MTRTPHRTLSRVRSTRYPRPRQRPSPPPVEIDADSWRVTRDGVEIALTKKEFDLLVFLIRNPHRVWSREALRRYVWSGADDRSGRTIDVHVHRLRAKLGAEILFTTRKVGYRINPAFPVSLTALAEDPVEPFLGAGSIVRWY